MHQAKILVGKNVIWIYTQYQFEACLGFLDPVKVEVASSDVKLSLQVLAGSSRAQFEQLPEGWIRLAKLLLVKKTPSNHEIGCQQSRPFLADLRERLACSFTFSCGCILT